MNLNSTKLYSLCISNAAFPNSLFLFSKYCVVDKSEYQKHVSIGHWFQQVETTYHKESNIATSFHFEVCARKVVWKRICIHTFMSHRYWMSVCLLACLLAGLGVCTLDCQHQICCFNCCKSMVYGCANGEKVYKNGCEKMIIKYNDEIVSKSLTVSEFELYGAVLCCCATIEAPDNGWVTKNDINGAQIVWITRKYET